MILTREILDQGKSDQGSWSAAQLKVFGVTEIVKGWPATIVGRDFPEPLIKKFLALRNRHLKDKKRDTKIQNSLNL